ncbi:hypothetical protein BTVI_47246 [Pitangus sulphuratus]|nr:hypothetical protein BTVI_47246 [Pitangus sulphuratus]
MVANSLWGWLERWTKANLQCRQKPIWATEMWQDITARVEKQSVKVHHVDAHVPKSRDNEEHRNKEQVDRAARIKVSQGKEEIPLGLFRTSKPMTSLYGMVDGGRNIGILEEDMNCPEDRNFEALPEKVTCAQEAPPYSKLPENERGYALFTDGSCHMDIAAQVENMTLNVCHVDVHMPKGRTTEEHQNNEQVDKATKTGIAQVELDWEERGYGVPMPKLKDEEESSLLESGEDEKESTPQRPKRGKKESSLPESGKNRIENSPQNSEKDRVESNRQKSGREEKDKKDKNEIDTDSSEDNPEEGTSHSYYTRAAEWKTKDKEGGKAKAKTKGSHTIAPL